MGTKMRVAVTLLALCLSAGPATAQTDQEIIWAMGEVGEELQVCSVYFTVVSGLPPAPRARALRKVSARGPKARAPGSKKQAERRRIARGLSRFLGCSVQGHEKVDGRELHKHRRVAEKVYEFLPAAKPGRRPSTEGMDSVLARAPEDVSWRALKFSLARYLA